MTRHRGHSTIDVLSDDDLLYIFDFYRQELKDDYHKTWPWHMLVHVCQRWRNIIFAWPQHLDLRPPCESRTAAARALDVWPTLPIRIHSLPDIPRSDNRDDIIDALEYRDRIAEIHLSFLTGSQLERCAAWLQEPFPLLRSLFLRCYSPYSGDAPVITDAFLGGSTPHLQRVDLSGIPVPTIPKFLTSAPDLVFLSLESITGTRHISPGQVATCVSMLKKLEYLSICFESRGSFPEPEPSNQFSPRTRAVLPKLAKFFFRGVSEYFEDLISRVDAPLLHRLYLGFFDKPIFSVPQLSQFFHRIEWLRSPLEAVVIIFKDYIDVSILPSVGGILRLDFLCTGPDRQMSLFAQFCAQCLPLLSHISKLYLTRFNPAQTDQQGSSPWLRFLRPFNSLQILDIWEVQLGVQIAGALGELTADRVAEVFPMLHTLMLRWFDGVESLVVPLLKPFVYARQLLDRPVEVQIIR